MEYIAAALEARGHPVTLADLRFSRSLEHQMRARARRSSASPPCTRSRPTTCWRSRARVRQLAPGVPIVIGGHTAAAYPEPFLVDPVDAVVLDDGERALPRIARRARRGRPLRDVPGLCCRDATRASRSPPPADPATLRARRRAAAGAPPRRRAGAASTPASRIGRPGWSRPRAAVRSAARSARSGSCTRARCASDRSSRSAATSRRSATTSSSPTISSGITRRAASRWRRSCAAAASASTGSSSRAASISSRGTRICSRRGGRSRRTSTSSSGSKRRPNEGLSGLTKDATVDQTAPGHRRRASLGYGVTGNFVIDPAWARSGLRAPVGVRRAPPAVPGRLHDSDAAARDRPTSRRCGRACASRPWAHFDMHHLLWEPALGAERFFELYCETWRRSVLNLRGRKSLWQWLREVDPRNLLFLMRALRADAADDGARALPRRVPDRAPAAAASAETVTAPLTPGVGDAGTTREDRRFDRRVRH